MKEIENAWFSHNVPLICMHIVLWVSSAHRIVISLILFQKIGFEFDLKAV